MAKSTSSIKPVKFFAMYRKYDSEHKRSTIYIRRLEDDLTKLQHKQHSGTTLVSEKREMEGIES